MTADNDTKQYSLEDLKERRKQGKTKTRPDAPKHAVEPEFWASARVVMPPPGNDQAGIDERETTTAALIEGEQSGVSLRRIPEIVAAVKQELQKPGG